MKIKIKIYEYQQSASFSIKSEYIEGIHILSDDNISYKLVRNYIKTLRTNIIDYELSRMINDCVIETDFMRRFI